MENGYLELFTEPTIPNVLKNKGKLLASISFLGIGYAANTL